MWGTCKHVDNLCVRCFERRKRLQDDVIASIRHFRATDRLSREKIHDRSPFRKRQ